MSLRSNLYATVGTAMFMCILITLKNEDNVAGLVMGVLRNVGFPLPKDYRFPYQVSITLDGEHYCGGSIVDENTVVTSVHCITAPPSFYLQPVYELIGFSLSKPVTLDVSRLGVEVGSKNRGEGATHAVIHAEYHENYNPITKDWDIAAIKVKDAFKFTAKVSPLLLAEDDDIKDGANAVVSGWGVQSKEDNPEKKTLKYANLPVRGGKYCDEFLKGKRTERMMCAGITKDLKDSCWGESGSPLVSDGKLIGISLWDEGCVSSTNLGVYTKVSTVQSWIKTKMGSV
ncbi:hypothetical protein J437_LFUL007414 [Ladona fulva]|uniref:Peptidase S1 domain-containing protein n=1 Tax=Ladona fulva TaxID=123851 RepID=A0A8K0NZ46_LADFU|nr:hypothetical protein J437_LFUL007414 [Ladona fulva]